MREQAQENQAAAAAAAAETGDHGKTNGHTPFSSSLVHAQSASQVPPETTAPFSPLSRIPTAPPLSTYPEETPESHPSPRPVQPPLPSIPDEPAPPLSPKKSDHQLRKERRALEKEKDKNERNRLKEQEVHNREMQRRETEELKRAIEASRAETADIAAENGSPRKSSSFGFLRRGSRSLSHRLNKEKEPRVSTSDLSTAPLLPEAVPEAPLNEPEPVQSPQPVQSPVSPREFSSLLNSKHPKQPISTPEPLSKDQHTNHTKHGHTPRWRSFSFKKVS